MAQSSPAPSSSPPPSGSKPAAAPAKKPRSPVERVVVWGGIAVLLVLAAYQARARVGYSMTLSALQDRLEEDEGSDAKQLLLKDLDSYIVGWPSRKQDESSAHKGQIELTWPGLSASYGIVVGYDPSEEGKPITGMETRGFQEPPPEEQPAPRNGAAVPGVNLPAGGRGGPPEGASAEAAAAPEADEPAAPAVAEPTSGEPAAGEPAADAPAEEPAPPADTGT